MLKPLKMQPKTHLRLSLRANLRLALACQLVFCQTTYAALTISPNPPPAISINAWSGSTGNLQGTSSFCVISTRNSNTRRSFDVAGYQISPSGTPGFVIRHTGTGHLLDIDMTYNAHTGVNYPLSNYSVTGYVTSLSQGSLNCTEGVSGITITLSAAELATAQAGTYQATLGIDFLQQGNAAYTGVLQFQVTFPQLVQISRLNDVALLPTSPFANLVAEEPFCIFRNGQGGFSIKATGANDSGGKFRLKNVLTVPYKVEIKQAGSYVTLTPNTTLNAATSGYKGISSRDCGGIDNTSLRLTVLASDANTVSHGTYTDVLVLLVAPN